MSLTTSSIRFPVTVIVGVLIVVISGLLALFRVPVQLTPEVERPIITITTNWIGASPEEIEKEIIEKQEQYLKSVEGIVEMSSESRDGQGVVTLEFLPELTSPAHWLRLPINSTKYRPIPKTQTARLSLLPVSWRAP